MEKGAGLAIYTLIFLACYTVYNLYWLCIDFMQNIHNDTLCFLYNFKNTSIFGITSSNHAIYIKNNAVYIVV